MNIKELSDLDTIQEEKSALLLFRNGYVIKINSQGYPKVLIKSGGKGPGEFIFASDLKIRNKKIYILDQKLRKISKYSLNGEHLKDISFHMPWARSFEVLPGGNIVTMNLSPRLHDGDLLITYNENGNKENSYGSNSILQPILAKISQIPAFTLNKLSSGEILITSVLTGTSFIYSFNEQNVTGRISIQGGPEWDAMVDFEKKIRKERHDQSHHRKVENVDFFSDGDILISWGGPFKKTRSISMIFSSNGDFLNRIFRNKDIKYRPTLFTLENDSTLWIYRRSTNILTRTKIRPIDHQKYSFSK